MLTGMVDIKVVNVIRAGIVWPTRQLGTIITITTTATTVQYMFLWNFPRLLFSLHPSLAARDTIKSTYFTW